jgi:hypothetical protein
MNTLLSLLNIKPKDSIIFDKDGNRFDYFSLKWLQNFKKGKYFDVIQKQGRNYFA